MDEARKPVRGRGAEPVEIVGETVEITSPGPVTDAPDFSSTSYAEVEAVIIRADGTRVDLGLVAANYKNPLKNIWWRTYGKPRAALRAKRANRNVSQGS